MDWIQSILTTDNIAISLCIAGFIVAGLGFRVLWGKIIYLEQAAAQDRETILALTAELNLIKGQNSMSEAINSFTEIIKKMDEKINLLHQKKLNR